MTWQGVPWAIGAHPGGTPETPAEAARTLAYQALGGREGPAAPPDCAVLPLAVPGAGVRIQPGVLGILNTFPGGRGQAYIVRQPDMEEVTLTATSSAGSRTDLIAVVVEDPQYPGQPVPADAAHGPYVRTRVFEGVAASTDSLSDVLPNAAGYALALVTRPASTGTVQTSHITDLREMPRPRQSTVKKKLDVGDKGTWDEINAATWERYPNAAGWNVKVPSWATKCHLELRVTGSRVVNDGTDAGSFRGRARLKLGSITSAEKILDPAIPDANKSRGFGYSLADEDLPIPVADRGTVLTLSAEAYRQSVTSGIVVREHAGTTVVATVTFIEAPTTDPVV